MKITSIQISNLFDIFDYSILFEKDKNVLIITGPNGYGKTTVLNIIYNLFNRQFSFFQSLPFNNISIELDEGIGIEITKQVIESDVSVKFLFLRKQLDNSYSELGSFTNKIAVEVERLISSYLPIRKLNDNRFTDLRTDRILTLDDLINEYGEELPAELKSKFVVINSEEINHILDSIPIHLIREQRLFKKTQTYDRNRRDEREHNLMVETIQTYAKELKQIIIDFFQKSIKEIQELDSSYPKRLISEQNILSEEEYTNRYNDLKIKQEKLTLFGLYESKQEFLAYSPDDAKALTVYLKDFEQKLSAFDDLLVKLELFTGILNDRRFTFKTIKINRQKGLFFETNGGNNLELNQLSSGEQHEVVLLYELIFNVRPNILVLIDEPEISLHVTWQKEFLSDILRIIKIQNIQVIIATHSPSIINDRWDLVYNLESVRRK